MGQARRQIMMGSCPKRSLILVLMSIIICIISVLKLNDTLDSLIPNIKSQSERTNHKDGLEKEERLMGYELDYKNTVLPKPLDESNNASLPEYSEMGNSSDSTKASKRTDNRSESSGKENKNSCPIVSSNDSNKTFPHGFPQVLKAGEFRKSSAHPYLSKDIWAELVDNQRTFFLRQYEDPAFPNMTTLRDWVRSRPHPITIVMNNYMDWSFKDDNFIEFQSLLDERNLHALFVDHLDSSLDHKKLKILCQEG